MRIAFSGGQGIGKTTLTEAISQAMNIPIIRANTRSMMPEGISSHLDVLKMAVIEPNKGVEFQHNLIKSRYELFKNTTGSFISDRCVLDSYVYYLMHNSFFDMPENVQQMKTLMKKSFDDLDVIIAFNTDYTLFPTMVS